MENRDQMAQYFLNLIQKSKRGKFKIYVGMSAGVGKTYRMLQEAQSLMRNGIDVQIAYIETHKRKETHELLDGLVLIPRRTLFYKGKYLEELDVQAVLNRRPEVVLVDELAHSNIQGSKNEKRWQDVLEILDAGINVISAVNIQHIESLNPEVKKITGIEVAERIPDSVLGQADELVNIDLTAGELIDRLKAGKIYEADKVELALQNFFKSEHILQLRELALKEVASHVEHKVETEIPRNQSVKSEKFLACISSNEQSAKNIIRKTARLAHYYHSKWFVMYVQLPHEAPDKIALDKQRHLINNFKLATELGAEIIKVEHKNITDAIMEHAEKLSASTVCIGRPRWRFFAFLWAKTFHRLLKKLSIHQIDLVILA